MRRKALFTAVALGTVGSLAAFLGPPSSAAPAAAPPSAAAAPQAARQPAGHPVVLVDCFWHGRVRPTDFVLACGDGNSRLSSLHWSRWDRAAAVARGDNWVNDCEPYCAAGHFHRYPVVVRLDHPQSWKKHPSLRHYAQIHLTYPDGRPAGFPRTVTYPLWN
jgi:hypothetical protein